jgi:aspartate carbamoyltransferase catalytic subunit
MSLAQRSLVTIDDLSNREIEAVFSLADEMSGSMSEQFGVCRGKIMASLFFEPSTRTRLSFEAAMHRMGGGVISAVDMGTTSLSKGESIADMARVVGRYADVIVIRHPWEGAAKVVAHYAGIPVINAGDGAHEHPTQTLCDLYTLKKERQTISGLTIALLGDLKYGRTIHSLTYALARFGANIIFRPGPGLELPEHVKGKLTAEYRGQLIRPKELNAAELEQADRIYLLRDATRRGTARVDAIYISPSRPHQPALMPDISIQIGLKKLKGRYDLLYVTRRQKERHARTAKGQESTEDYLVVDKKLLKEQGLEETLVMHPLPRIDELAYEIDADPRSMYFEQAARGVPIRMALISLLLGVRRVDIPEEEEPAFVKKVDYPVYRRDFGAECANENCVSRQGTERKYIRPEFEIVAKAPLTLRCVYCEHEAHPRYIASSEQNNKYHSADSFMLEWIKPEHLIIFDSEVEAKTHGFSPGQYAHISTKRG